MGTNLLLKHKEMYLVMNRVVTALTNADIKWWMAYETLLGAVRNGGIIPNNDTMSLQIMDQDLSKINLISGVNVTPSPKGYTLSVDGSMYTVDVVVMTRKFDYLYVKSEADRGVLQWNLERYEFNFLFPLIRLQLGPLLLYAPQQPHEWLWRVYGLNYMNPRANSTPR